MWPRKSASAATLPRPRFAIFAAVLTVLMLAGCTNGAGTPNPAAHTTTPPPAKGVSSAAVLHGTCVMGYIPTGQGAVFNQGPPQSQVISGTTYPPVIGYQVTFANQGSSTAEVTGWVVAFYDSSGQELGSDEETAKATFITAEQSLTWTEYATTDTAGGQQSFGSDSSIPADGSAATCQVINYLGGPG